MDLIPNDHVSAKGEAEINTLEFVRDMYLEKLVKICTILNILSTWSHSKELPKYSYVEKEDNWLSKQNDNIIFYFKQVVSNFSCLLLLSKSLNS